MNRISNDKLTNDNCYRDSIISFIAIGINIILAFTNGRPPANVFFSANLLKKIT